MEISSIIITILTITSSLLGIWLKSVYDMNVKLREELDSKKQAVYTELISYLIDLANDVEFRDDENLEKWRDFYKKMSTFASNEVLLAYGDFLQYVYRNERNMADTKVGLNLLKLLAHLILAIRNDMGQKKRFNNLNWVEVARPWIKDLDSYIGKRYLKIANLQKGPKIKLGNNKID